MTDRVSYNACMSRIRPESRLIDLLRCAAEVFITSQGYERTQMGDIAAKAGISKGAVYLCVESKAALFDLALRHADNPESFQPPPLLPVPTPAEGTTRRYVSERLTTQPDLLELISALANKRVTNAREELEEVIRRLYRLLNDNRWAIKLVDVSAIDHPELADLWHEAGRGGITSLLEPFIAHRIQNGHYAKVPDITICARYILETCVLWAVHMHWDPHPEPHNQEDVETTLVHLLSRSLLT